MKKPTVLFPYVEAGMGHIVPMKAIARKFKELYGEKVNCREISFYLASGIVELSQLNTGKNCRLYPLGYTERIQEYIAAADLFCGKGGANTLSEATFAGVPQIVTNYASGVEKLNGEYYVKEIKTVLKIFKPEKVVNAVERFIRNPSELDPFRAAAENQRQNYGAEQSARLIFGLLLTRFPELA